MGCGVEVFVNQPGCPGALDGFEFMWRQEPFGGWFVNGAEKLGHWGGVTVYHRPDDCRSKSVRMATLQEYEGTALAVRYASSGCA